MDLKFNQKQIWSPNNHPMSIWQYLKESRTALAYPIVVKVGFKDFIAVSLAPH